MPRWPLGYTTLYLTENLLREKKDTFPLLMPAVGLEPTTTRLKVLRSTDWAKQADVARLLDKWNLTMKRDTFPPYMTAAGFEPAKRLSHRILSPTPLTGLGDAV